MISLRRGRYLISRVIAKVKLILFEFRINNSTKNNSNLQVLQKPAVDVSCKPINDDIVQMSMTLGEELKTEFCGVFSALKKTRILVHLADKNYSPAGFSLFKNLGDSIEYLGVPVYYYRNKDSLTKVLEEFNPTHFISCDNQYFTEAIDWAEVRRFKEKRGLTLGLTASIEEYGNTNLLKRLEFSKSNDVDFFYSWRTQSYLEQREEYRPFFENGFKIFSVEQGANIIDYYPTPVYGDKKFDYIFLGSSNPDKIERYRDWFSKIFELPGGYVNGPGWRHCETSLSQKSHAAFYSSSRVGLNLHIDDSIYWPSELNQRTYIIAACGIPQLVDNPMLMSEQFPSGSYYMGSTPEEYLEKYNYIIENQVDTIASTLLALEHVLKHHSTFSRASGFINDIRRV